MYDYVKSVIHQYFPLFFQHTQVLASCDNRREEKYAFKFERCHK